MTSFDDSILKRVIVGRVEPHIYSFETNTLRNMPNIGDLSNVKRFKRESGRIILLSESHRQEGFSPIFIDAQDDYTIEGKVVDIVKAVKL